MCLQVGEEGGVNVVGRFESFTIENGIISVTINIIVNNTFKGVVSSLIRGIVVPPVKVVVNNISFSGQFVGLKGAPITALTRTGRVGIPIVTCKRFFGAVVSFLVVTFIVFLIVHRVGETFPGRRTTPTHAYRFYGRPVTSSTAHYPRYATILSRAGWFFYEVPSLFLQEEFFANLFLALFPLRAVVEGCTDITRLMSTRSLKSYTLHVEIQIPSLTPFSVDQGANKFFCYDRGPF